MRICYTHRLKISARGLVSGSISGAMTVKALIFLICFVIPKFVAVLILSGVNALAAFLTAALWRNK